MTVAAYFSARSSRARCEAGDCAEQAVDFGAAIEAGVGGDLVVARAGGVEFGAGRADAAGEFRLDVHVDVLQRGLELEVAGCDVRLDFAQAGFDRGKLVGGEQAGHELGAGMGDGAGDVVREQAPVIGDGFAELLDERRGVLGEAAFPHGAGGSLVVRGQCFGKMTSWALREPRPKSSPISLLVTKSIREMSNSAQSGLQDFQRLGFDRAAEDFLEDGQGDVAAIEHRERQHVEHREVHVEQAP